MSPNRAGRYDRIDAGRPERHADSPWCKSLPPGIMGGMSIELAVAVLRRHLLPATPAGTTP